jgi:transcriptional regulator with XRE-family HTH domain
LQKALLEEADESGVTQSKIALHLGVHRSVISRELNGSADITLGRVAELAFTLGREIEFSLPKRQMTVGVNAPFIHPLATKTTTQANIAVVTVASFSSLHSTTTNIIGKAA